MNWLQALTLYADSNQPCVVATVIVIDGSAPRAIGARMVITGSDFVDTLGGGALELEVISHARALLCMPHSESKISQRTFSLSTDLSQCCGGRVTVQFEHHCSNDFTIHVFGAGHIAQQVLQIAQSLPCRITFHDSRPEWIGRLKEGINHTRTCSIYSSVQTRDLGANPFVEVELCEQGAYYLIMTHSHELDFDLVEAVLSRSDSRYCGLVASKSKAGSFRGKLRRKGFGDHEVSQLTAPLGVAVKTGNTPMEVAVAAISDILNIRYSSQPILGGSLADPATSISEGVT